MFRVLIVLAFTLFGAACRTKPVIVSMLSPAVSTKDMAEKMQMLTNGYFEVPPALAAGMTQRIFQVIALDRDEATFGCGAVIWHNGKLCLITCAHAVMIDPTPAEAEAARLSNFAPINKTRARASLLAKDYKNNLFSLKLVHWKRQFDLALLEITDERGKVLPETITKITGHAEAGDEVYIAGFRQEIGRRAIPAAIEKYLPGINVNLGELVLGVCRTCQPTFHGFSGGPVFAHDGETLVGINIAIRGNESYFSSPTNIQWLLSGK